MTQTPHIDALSHDPLPARISQGSPMWRLRISGERMVFGGRTFGMHIAGGLLLAPVIYWTCGQWGAARGVQFGLTLFPIFYAGGMAVGRLVTMAAIPRIECDRSRQRVFLPLGRELALSDLLAVQVIEYLRKWGGDDELFAYQLNLCYIDRHKSQRMHLVECSDDEPLIRDAQLMSSTLGVPLHEHYLTSEALLAWESREARAITKLAGSTLDFGVRHPREGEAPAEPLTRVDASPGSRLSRSFALPGGPDSTPKSRLDRPLAGWLLVFWIMATMLFAAFGLVMARQPDWPRWNDPLWIGLLIPTV